MQPLFYPVLGGVQDLWAVRLSGHGIGNSFFAYFHAVRLASQVGGQVITPAWLSLKVGPLLRLERSWRTNLGEFLAHPDELSGFDKFAALARYWKQARLVDASDVVVQRPARLNVVISPSFVFGPLMDEREVVRERLLQISRRKYRDVLWGRGGFIGVHVRLGDFARTNDVADVLRGKANTRIPLDWYLTAMDAVRIRHPELPVKIFSDGSLSELASLLRPGVTVCRTESDLGDLIALSSSSVLIGSNSTFSRWAAFLGDMPSVWVRTEKAPEKPTSPPTRVAYLSLKPTCEELDALLV